MKLIYALLLASTSAINIKLTPLAGHPAAENTCVNVRKDSKQSRLKQIKKGPLGPFFFNLHQTLMWML